MNRYTYQPLLPAKHSIRLIQILPGLPRTEIHCRIVDYTIRDDRVSGPFEALSYVWGETTNLKRIFVADITGPGKSENQEGYLKITSNLHEALQELRDPALPRIMWIDAVCINQEDLQERASQVNFMAEVYSHAQQVVVWLGVEDHITKELFTAIEDAAEVACQTTSTENPEFLRTAHENLLRLPWFSRVWVLQEAAAAQILLVKCGAFQLHGSMFTRGIRFLQGQTIGNDPNTSVFEIMDWNLSALNRSRSPYLVGDLPGGEVRRRFSLGILLERFHRLGASDRRDTVFAMLNLCSPDSRRCIVPDYTKSWSTVWADTIKQILGPKTIVTISPKHDQACLTTFGHVLGTIGIYNDSTRMWVESTIWNVPGTRWTAAWSHESWYSRIQDGDILYFSTGAAEPSIIRACDDHFDIVLMALPAPEWTYIDLHPVPGQSSFDWSELLLCLTHGPRRVSLVWDWCPAYPDSCNDHHLLFDAATGPHPQEFTRVEDCANILASLRPSMDSEEHITNQQFVSHLLRKSEQPAFPSPLRTKLHVLQSVFSHRRVHTWLIKQYDDLHQALWLLKRPMEYRTRRPWPLTRWEFFLNYCRSEGYPNHNTFDLMSITGLQARLQEDGTTVSWHVADSSDMQIDKYLSNLFETGLYAHESPDSVPKSGIRRDLCTMIIRQSNTTLADLCTSSHSLLAKPCGEFDDSRKQNKPGETHINLRAFALISACVGGPLTLTRSELRSAITSSHGLPSVGSLYFTFLLFPKPLIDLQTRYNILSVVFGMWPNATPISLQQGIDQYWNRTNSTHSEKVEVFGIDYHKDDLFDAMESYHCYKRKCHSFDFDQCLITLFIHKNFKSLMWYIENTEILEIAEATADDNVLPFLRNFLDLDLSRSFSRRTARILGRSKSPLAKKSHS